MAFSAVKARRQQEEQQQEEQQQKEQQQEEQQQEKQQQQQASRALAVATLLQIARRCESMLTSSTASSSLASLLPLLPCTLSTLPSYRGLLRCRPSSRSDAMCVTLLYRSRNRSRH
jgi:transcription initiation factor TFIID subunit TAF12